MEIITFQTNSNKPLQQFSTDVIRANNWQVLIDQNRFDAEKAYLSLQATKMDFLRDMPHQSIKDVDEAPTASLATIKMYSGELKMIACISALIVQAASLLSVGKATNEYQVKEAAKLIYSEYYFLTVADLKVALMNGIMGKFGQIYDRIDVSVIFQWLNAYVDQRAAYFEEKQMSKRKMQAAEMNDKAIDMPDYIRKKFAQMEAKASKIKNATSPSQKFASLAAFLEAINATDKHEYIMSAWNAAFMSLQEKTIEMDAYLYYRANKLLCQVNDGHVSDWQGVLDSLKL
jgi:hypothetical protein